MRVDLTEYEVDHLLTLLLYSLERGDYYGSRYHYWRRHNRIVAKLDPAGALKSCIADLKAVK